MRIFLYLILSFLMGLWIGILWTGQRPEKDIQPVSITEPIYVTIYIQGDIFYADYGNLQIIFEKSDEIFDFKNEKELTKFIEGYTAQSVIEHSFPFPPDDTNSNDTL